MKFHVIAALAFAMFALDAAPLPDGSPTGRVADVQAQARPGSSRGASGGRTAKKSGNVKKSSPSRGGSTSRPSTTGRRTPGATPGRSTTPGRTTPGATPGRGTPGRSAGPGTSGPRNSAGRRTVSRRNVTPSRRRARPRRVGPSRRWRRGVWRHHRFWRHRHWYWGWWPGRVIIRTAAFIAIANSSTTHVHASVTYYHYNPWYRPVLHDGEEGYVLTTAPVGWQTSDLPAGSEQITHDGATYHYHDGAFYQSQGGGYVVVAAPSGAEVSSLPDGAEGHEEGDVTLYQFDKVFFTQDVNASGARIYRVEPVPPEEELDAIPPGSPSFVADAETFYYVDKALYVEYEEGGRTGYVNGGPDIGAEVDQLPSGTTTIEDGGVTYHQFDMVFFEQVEDESGSTFYQVVDAPGETSVDLGS